jgi:hypothetical protein
LWRGGDLPATVFDAADLRVRGDDEVIFSHEVQANVDGLASLLKRIGISDLRIYYPGIDKCETAQSATGHDVAMYLADDGFSESVYLVSSDYLIYSNTRDTLSIIILASSVAAEFQIDEWDVAFSNHVALNGIGFGQEGRDYLRSLIDSFIVALPNKRDRFEKILFKIRGPK